MSANSPARKRSRSPAAGGGARGDVPRYSSSRRDEEETPWWEQARGGDERDSRGSYGGGGGGRGRYDERDNRGGERRKYDERRYDDRRSSSGSNRGGRGGYERGGYGGRGGGPGGPGGRRDHGDYRAGPPRNGADYHGAHQPAEGDFLNYSDAPARPPPNANRSPAGARDRQRSLSAAPPSAFVPASAPIPATMDTTITIPPSGPTPALKPQDEGPDLELEIAAPVDPEAIIAERRRKRAEILKKYAATASSSAVTSTAVSEEGSRVGTPGAELATPGRESVERGAKRLKLGTESPRTTATTPLPDNTTETDLFDLAKDADSTTAHELTEADSSTHLPGEEEVSAADYNPDEDRKNDDRRYAERALIKEAEEKRQADAAKQVKQVKREAVVIADDDDDDDDMFSTAPPKPSADTSATDIDADPNAQAFVPIIHRSGPSDGLVDNYDDSEGYYKLLLGELLDSGRYHVIANLGKGMFSGVVRARDLGEGGKGGDGKEVAIKVIRSQESMYKAGLKEAAILRRLMEADPDDKKHLVRLLRTFEHRGHLCLVFENLNMNLREIVKRFGKDVGINLRAVRAYASQMFLGLALMKKCDIMHADLKPDNILVNESKSVLKICDLGSASDTSENDITPYLVSRFYRAPEIILGLPYDCSLDTWSIGCTLYELYTGKILFPGRTNNHMLLLIMELKGKFNHKLLKKAKFTENHFDERLDFLQGGREDTQKTLTIPSKATHDLRSRLMPASAMKKLKEDEVRLLGHFVDLLERMLSLEGAKRPTPKELLNHAFFK